MIGLVAATANGGRNARHLRDSWPDAVLYEGVVRESVARAWRECDGVVIFLATGAALRLVSGLLGDKDEDPGVVTVDDGCRFAVSLCGGHEGGANELARRVAGSLGAEPVITTASEAVETPSLGAFGAELGFTVEDGPDLAAVGRAVVSGDEVLLVSERRWPLGPLPHNVVRAESPRSGTPSVVISDRIEAPGRSSRPSVVYRPSSLVVGVGCSRGAAADEILGLLRSSLREAGLSEKSVARLASVEAKRDEAGPHEAAAILGVGITFYPAEALSTIEAPNPSEAVMRAVGTPSVSEAAALAEGGELVVEKQKSANATVAVVRTPVRGRLYLISLGPGDDGLIPPMAREALWRSALVVGLDQYVDRVRHVLRPGTRVEMPPLGSEVERAETAILEARAGGSAALVSSGDIGVYAMGSPALEALGDADGEVEVISVPGITAANAAASLLGSPLGHDHCSISLSDLLTPWEAIERRIRAAGAGDFVVSFYNPRSRGRDWQLGKARDILLEHRSRETPIGLVTDAYRPTQTVKVTDLGSLRVEDVDMLTVVIVGGSQTRVMDGRMVTPRGYTL
ncbi:precorrin-3B C(17)-methyltransferase [Rubrobacter aplysinae]|uniref:precorrin-3B C(17)-methyltransferase n=1 Tax=Rubrobacter aplysinae TaxID=909625 RepID=UPI00064B9B67|nr:precorrin-3B C(17)-methyltransferase [Rubrobacter aplysinae]